MKLLILTQKVDKNDGVLGFFHRWIEEFAKRCERVTVVCLEEGAHELPENVEVFSLGKEELRIRNYELRSWKRLRYIFNFYKYIWKERKKYDRVFAHMNAEYVALGGLLWRLLGKRTALWYVHRNVHWKLRLAEKLAHVIFTASKESFRLSSGKLHIVGHGIDLKRFKRPKAILPSAPINILHVGRVTPIKNLETLVKAAYVLRNDWEKRFVITLIGAPATEKDESYEDTIRSLVAKYGLGNIVQFVGSVSNKEIQKRYWRAHALVNLCPTGGVDKAVLEAMAAETLVVVSNKTFAPLFGQYAETLMFPTENARALAEKIKNLFAKNETEREKIRAFLYKEAQKHSVERLIEKVVSVILE